MIGVLVMAYGGPGNLDEVEPYLLDVRNYRPTSEEIIHEVRQRYQQIGGRSPILERTKAQAECIQSVLDRRGSPFKVFVGMRHWKPFIKDALAEISAAGISRVVGLVMAPHYSRRAAAYGSGCRREAQRSTLHLCLPVRRNFERAMAWTRC